MSLFGKSTIVGVSITPERGLEVAEINFETRTVLKYGSKQLDYNVNARRIADMDIFKDTLQDLLTTMEISKNAKVVLSIPAVTFKISEYPASMDEVEITNAISESLMSEQIFESEEPCFSAVQLPGASIQFNRIAYTAAQFNVVSEIVMAIRDLGYKIYAIDNSVTSIYNALDYVGRINNIEADTSWVLMIVDSFMCRVIPMIGYNPVDVYEERITIGEVLDDAENYASVLSTAQPILKNTPSKFLYILSDTKIIDAEVLADRLQYGARVIHQNAGVGTSEAFINVSPNIPEEEARNISLDVIGAAIRKSIEPYKTLNLNLYNKSLGQLYIQDQPPQIGSLVLSAENLVKAFILIAIIIIAGVVACTLVLQSDINKQRDEEERIKAEIATIDAYLAANPGISANSFDEGFEITKGLMHNKAVYSYYSIVGTEIPRKLWLTHLKLGDKITIEGQADNIESIYSFFRNVKDYDAQSDISLQKLGLASGGKQLPVGEGDFEAESLLTSANADYYEFRISNEPEVAPAAPSSEDETPNLPLEPIE